MSDLVLLARQTRLIADVVRRGLQPIVVVGPTTSLEQLEPHRADPTHPLSALKEVIQVPDSSVDTALVAIQPFLRNYTVEAAICCGEVFVEPVGVIAECLGLAGPGSNASRICRNKVLQRMALPQVSPRAAVVGPAERRAAGTLWSDFPAVVKPADRMYSSGVQRVDTAGGLAAAVREYPAGELLLVEEQVTGPEFSVEALVSGGDVLWSGITAKLTNEGTTRFFTEMGHTSPADGIDGTPECALAEANAEVLRVIGFRDGITHAEFRLSNGVPVLMEVAARLPGDAITMLWHMATGIPLEPAIVDLALGLKPDSRQPIRRAQQVFLEHPRGVLEDVRAADATVSWLADDGAWPTPEPVDANHPARCCAVLVSRQRGDLLGEQRDSGERSVSIVVDCPLNEDITAVSRRWAGKVRVIAAPTSGR